MAEIKNITRLGLENLIESGENFKLVDVLSEEHYQKEHLQGAINLPADQIEHRAGVVLDKEDTIIVYCAGFECQASAEAADRLTSLGFKNVLRYEGGIKDWKEANLPIESNLKE